MAKRDVFVDFECPHRRSAATCSECMEIRRLAEDARGEDPPPRHWVTAGLCNSVAGEDEAGQQTLWLARYFQLRKEGQWWKGDPRPALSPPARREVVGKAREKLRQFFSQQSIVHEAVQHGALTERQGQHVAHCLAEDVSYARIAEWTGWSKATVVRDLQAVCRLVSQPVLTHNRRESETKVFVSRERGDRRRSVLRKQAVRIGPWRWWRFTLITDRVAVRRVLRNSPRSQDKLVEPMPDSAMNKLTAALMSTLSDNVELLPPDASVTDSPDWRFNLKWAQRRIGRGPADAERILAALVRECPSCVHCRTPILVGCKLNGRIVRGDRACCSDGCRKARSRRSTTRRLKERPPRSTDLPHDPLDSSTPGRTSRQSP